MGWSGVEWGVDGEGRGITLTGALDILSRVQRPLDKAYVGWDGVGCGGVRWGGGRVTGALNKAYDYFLQLVLFTGEGKQHFVNHEICESNSVTLMNQIFKLYSRTYCPYTKLVLSPQPSLSDVTYFRRSPSCRRRNLTTTTRRLIGNVSTCSLMWLLSDQRYNKSTTGTCWLLVIFVQQFTKKIVVVICDTGCIHITILSRRERDQHNSTLRI